ncbi:UPF0598 protein CG30010-like [Clavelina lepadiformis]|uniref:UPF0598 protein CG30010-like n=1 Tax=Clavelina lepadiformis TaxID=159417 RepID=UPI004043184E
MLMLRNFLSFKVFSICGRKSFSSASYVQGQSPKTNTREYFYYIDHQGQLFLDDAKVKNFISCFQDKEFLAFFFRRIRINNTGRYENEFPYVSRCGKEKNYIRCDDVPIVYTHILDKETSSKKSYHLSYGNTGDILTVPFEPEKICMLPESCRVYHPAPERTGGIGLVKSKLAIQLSQYFSYDHQTDKEFVLPPTKFTWQGKTYDLTNDLLHIPRIGKF